MPETSENPYRPGRGVAPPLLAGRGPELEAARRRLAELEGGRSPSQDLLFYGPRGNGKTTLLIHIAEQARKRGMRVEELPVDALTDRARLVRELQERAGVIRDRVTGIQVAAAGVTTDRAPPTENISRLLTAWLRVDRRPLALLLDEAQALSPETSRPFFDAVQTAKRDHPPFLLLAAGTPDAPRRICQAGTHNERGFQRFPVERLDREATLSALSRPAEAEGRPMSDTALALLARESQDYPFFIQLLGSAAWDAASGAEETTISDAAARRGVEAAHAEMDRFYLDRFAEVRERKAHRALAPLATACLRRGGRLDDDEIEQVLAKVADRDSPPSDWVALLAVCGQSGVSAETGEAPG